MRSIRKVLRLGARSIFHTPAKEGVAVAHWMVPRYPGLAAEELAAFFRLRRTLEPEVFATDAYFMVQAASEPWGTTLLGGPPLSSFAVNSDTYWDAIDAAVPEFRRHPQPLALSVQSGRVVYPPLPEGLPRGAAAASFRRALHLKKASRASVRLHWTDCAAYLRTVLLGKLVETVSYEDRHLLVFTFDNPRHVTDAIPSECNVFWSDIHIAFSA